MIHKPYYVYNLPVEVKSPSPSHFLRNSYSEDLSKILFDESTYSKNLGSYDKMDTSYRKFVLHNPENFVIVSFRTLRDSEMKKFYGKLRKKCDDIIYNYLIKNSKITTRIY